MWDNILIRHAAAVTRHLMLVSVSCLLMLAALSCASTEKAGAIEVTAQPPAQGRDVILHPVDLPG